MQSAARLGIGFIIGVEYNIRFQLQIYTERYVLNEQHSQPTQNSKGVEERGAVAKSRSYFQSTRLTRMFG